MPTQKNAMKHTEFSGGATPDHMIVSLNSQTCFAGASRLSLEDEDVSAQ